MKEDQISLAPETGNIGDTNLTTPEKLVDRLQPNGLLELIQYGVALPTALGLIAAVGGTVLAVDTYPHLTQNPFDYYPYYDGWRNQFTDNLNIATIGTAITTVSGFVGHRLEVLKYNTAKKLGRIQEFYP